LRLEETRIRLEAIASKATTAIEALESDERSIRIRQLGTLVRTSAHDCRHVADRIDCPPLRNYSKLGILELAGEQGSGGGVHAYGLAAFGLGTYGVEVYEPGLEQSLGDGFEGGVGLT